MPDLSAVKGFALDATHFEQRHRGARSALLSSERHSADRRRRCLGAVSASHPDCGSSPNQAQANRRRRLGAVSAKHSDCGDQEMHEPSLDQAQVNRPHPLGAGNAKHRDCDDPATHRQRLDQTRAAGRHPLCAVSAGRCGFPRWGAHGPRLVSRRGDVVH
jgi:hypothetical protein